MSLSLRWLQNRPALAGVAARQAWYDRLVSIVGATTTTNLSGFPSFKVELLADPQVAEAIQAYLIEIVAFVRADQSAPA